MTFGQYTIQCLLLLSKFSVRCIFVITGKYYSIWLTLSLLDNSNSIGHATYTYTYYTYTGERTNVCVFHTGYSATTVAAAGSLFQFFYLLSILWRLTHSQPMP